MCIYFWGIFLCNVVTSNQIENEKFEILCLWCNSSLLHAFCTVFLKKDTIFWMKNKVIPKYMFPIYKYILVHSKIQTLKLYDIWRLTLYKMKPWRYPSWNPRNDTHNRRLDFSWVNWKCRKLGLRFRNLQIRLSNTYITDWYSWSIF